MGKMEALAGQLAAQNDKYLRLAAEYDNYRKRTAKEKESIYQDAKIDTIARFLEVYDNLERAVTQAGDEDNVHKKGMEMIFHQLEGVLEKMGVTILDPMGETFDPDRHSAVMHIDSEELGENVVSQVFQKGFLLGEKVIRFAAVQVAN
ncbi:MAG: nucleotide exchange factor GrpE [Oscillibacter sp.]|nr:nucleotide exchange factor GrpE [Oscillibacter sp.]